MHLGHFALVNWMLETKLLDRSSSVLMVASDAMRASGFHPSLFEGEVLGNQRKGLSL